jgi:hypothetical protein
VQGLQAQQQWALVAVAVVHMGSLALVTAVLQE